MCFRKPTSLRKCIAFKDMIIQLVNYIEGEEGKEHNNKVMWTSEKVKKKQSVNIKIEHKISKVIAYRIGNVAM